MGPKGAAADSETRSVVDLEGKTSGASDAKTAPQPEAEESRKRRKKKHSRGTQSTSKKEAISAEQPDPAVSAHVSVAVQAHGKSKGKEAARKGVNEDGSAEVKDETIVRATEEQAADVKQRKKRKTRDDPCTANDQRDSPAEPAMLRQVSSSLPGDLNMSLGEEVHGKSKCKYEQDGRKISKGLMESVQVEAARKGVREGGSAEDVRATEKQAADVKQQKKRKSRDDPSSANDQWDSPAEPAMLGQVSSSSPGDLNVSLGKEVHGKSKGKDKHGGRKRSNGKLESLESVKKEAAGKGKEGGSGTHQKTQETPELEVTDPEIEAAELEKQQPEGIKTLCVGNLPHNMLPEQLMGFFAQNGFSVMDYLLPCHGGVIRGFGYVEFATSQEAKMALDSLDELQFMGHLISLKPAYEDISSKRAAHSRENWGVGKAILVAGLDTSLEEHMVKESLEQHFAECKIKNVRVRGQTDKETGLYSNEGKAIVEFNDFKSFQKAKERYNVPLDGKKLVFRETKQPIGMQGFICVPCGGTGIVCMTCGAVVGGRTPATQHVWVGTGSRQPGSTNVLPQDAGRWGGRPQGAVPRGGGRRRGRGGRGRGWGR